MRYGCHYAGRTNDKRRTSEDRATYSANGSWRLSFAKKDEGSVLNVLCFQLLLHGFRSPDKWHWQHHSLLDCQQPAKQNFSLQYVQLWQIYNTSLQCLQNIRVSKSFTFQRGPYHAPLLEKQEVLILILASFTLYTAMHSCAFLHSIFLESIFLAIGQ